MQLKMEVLRSLMQIRHLHMMFNYHCAGYPPVHPSQFQILHWIGNHEGCTQTDIAQHLMIRPATVATSIRRLEKTEHIRRVRDDSDGRIWHVFLAEKAREYKIRMQAHIEEELGVMLKGFEPGEIEELQKYLQRIQENLERSIAERRRDHGQEYCGLTEKKAVEKAQ